MTTTNKARTIGYWVTTTALAFAWVSGGAADLIQYPDTLAGMVELGYPAYVLTVLGVWKILGAVAILVPRFPLLKEWAYAGTFFELSGAIASHAASGSSTFHLLSPGFFLVCAVASWALRPSSRTIVGTRLQNAAPVRVRTSEPAAA